MKRLIIITIIFFSINLITNIVNAQLRVTDEGFVQVDYTSSSSNTSLTIGYNASSNYPARGKWAMEYWVNGFNFWIPWPNTGYGNYMLFLEDGSGYIGMNEGNPSYRLDVNGDTRVQGTFYNSSDKRLKSNIQDLGNTLDNVKKLNGVSFTMKSSKPITYDLSKISDTIKLKMIEAEMASFENTVAEKSRIGFIAQDLKEIYPDLVAEDEEGYLSIDYIGIIPILTEAIKELEARIETLENDCCNSTGNLKSGEINSTNKNSVVNAAKLYQNMPNPYTVQTTISFGIPQEVNSAQLHICNMTGTLLKTITVNQRGAGNVLINANEFVAGMYLYSLVCDGKIVDTKQMLLTE